MVSVKKKKKIIEFRQILILNFCGNESPGWTSSLCSPKTDIISARNNFCCPKKIYKIFLIMASPSNSELFIISLYLIFASAFYCSNKSLSPYGLKNFRFVPKTWLLKRAELKCWTSKLFFFYFNKKKNANFLILVFFCSFIFIV